MNWIITLYIALLFFALTPGVLVSLPPKRGKFTVAAVHALIFAGIWHFTHKFVWITSMNMFAPAKHEGMEDEKADDKPLTPAQAAEERIKAAAAAAAAAKQ